MASETRVALVTVTEAVPVTVPELAVMEEVPAATAVATPLEFTVTTFWAVEDHCTVGSNWVLPSSKAPVAENCCSVAMAMVADAGVMEMEFKWAPTTVNTMESEREPTAAAMVVVPPVRSVARPVVSIVATPGADEVQATPLVRSWLEPSAYSAVTVNC